MKSPRWSKVASDLLSNKARTLLVVVAIAVGIFAFGSVFITQEVLVRNLKVEYINSKASNITLYLSDFDTTLIRWVSSQPGVSGAAGKTSASVMFQGKDKEIILNLVAVPDFNNMNLNLLIPQTGSWPPQKGEIILERGSLPPSNSQIGDEIEIKGGDERIYNLVMAGTAYDNSAIPYIFMNQMTGYVSLDTMSFLGYGKDFNQLEIQNNATIKTRADAERFTYDLIDNLDNRGVEVLGSMVLPPGRHWAEDNSKAFTAILSVIGVFSLVLSGFLVVNTISALVAQQKKQVGIMKAIGARRNQITVLYLAMVGIYGLLALLVALPIGLVLSYVFLKMIANFLNLDIILFYLPPSVFFMEVAASLVVPIFAALIPVVSGTKKSVREVLSEYQTTKKAGFVDRLVMNIKGISRPNLISLRNVFRVKGRLLLTLGTLVTAGALFMSVINVRSGMYLELERILQMFDFDVDISLVKDYDVVGLVSRVEKIPNISEVETRTQTSVKRLNLDGTKSSPFPLSGLPYDTVFSHPVVLSGRWLERGDAERVVLSSSYVRDNPDLAVGGDLYVEATSGNKYHLEIVGIIAMSGDQKLGFMNFDDVAKIKDAPGVASSILVKVDPESGVSQDQIANKIQDDLERAGIDVAQKTTRNEIFGSAANQFNFLIFFLLMMAVMVAIVGGLGLGGTMSLNVLERTREIGIMRSIGAGNKEIRKLVMIEGMMVGLFSWVIAVPLSLPITYAFCYMIGNAFFERVLVFNIVPMGMLIWLIVIIIIATVASILPARRASKMSISETLSYE